MKTTKFEIKEYGDDPISVYVMTNEKYDLNEVVEFLRDNYKDHEKLEFIEENDLSVNQELGYKYVVIFHLKTN